jgi:predicted RND superfamily exporter protein
MTQASPSKASFSAWLARTVVRRPKQVLAATLLAMCAVLPLVEGLRLHTDVVDLFPRHDPETEAFARFSRSFISEQVLLILVESEDPERLTQFADRLAPELQKLPQVLEVRYRLSGTTASFLRDHLLLLLDDDEMNELAKRMTPEGLRAQVRRIRGLLAAPGGSALAPVLTADPLEALPLVQGRLSSGLPVDAQSGYFRSADKKALLLFVRPKTGAFDVEADRQLMAATADLARRLGARVSDDGVMHPGAQPEIAFTGPCAYTLFWRDWLHRDMQLSTTLSGVAVLLLFALFFRALRVMPFVGAPLLVGLIWTAGAAALLYGRINAVSLAFGTLLLSIGIDLPIQLYNRLREELAEHPPLDALETTVRSLAAPSLTATLGPAVVFFACGLSRYRGLNELGVLAGIGLLLNLIAMLTVFPSLLAVLRPSWWAQRSASSATGPMAKLGRAAAARPRTVLLLAAALGLAAVPLAARVHFERRLISVQPRAMPAAVVEREVQQRFGARQNLLIALVEDPDHDRALSRSDAWLDEAERLRRRGVIRGYESVSSLFPSQATQAARRARLAKLEPAKVARQLRAELEEAGFEVAPFEPFLRQLEGGVAPIRLEDAGELSFLVHAHVHDDPEGRRVATFFYPHDDNREAAKALRQFAAASGSVVTGTTLIEGELHKIVARDTLRVTVAAAAAVLLLLALFYRRWRPFVAVSAPLVLAWIGFAAALSLFDIPLNLFNLLAVPLVIGYGIDDHVFLVHRFEEDPSHDPGLTLSTTGRAIVLTSLSTTAGFAGLAIARFEGLRLLGLSGALAVLFCLLAAFAVLPALMSLLWPRR